MNRELEKQIVDKILGEGYDKRIRPSGINNKTGQNGEFLSELEGSSEPSQEAIRSKL